MPDVLKRVGRFDLLRTIGRGGAAVVYLAVQRDLQRHVALKELSPYHLADSTFAERFVEESRLAGAMNHANVVTVHEFFEDGGVPYIAMEYLPHGSLRQYIGRLTIAQIAGVLEGVLAGLAHGEAHGIVHRDLKPENLLVSADGRVKIADFGVARAYSNAATRAVVTVTGTTIGTPAYMSPEQALGGNLTPATDLYSLGVVAWELLTGQVPFEETDTPVAVLYRHVHEPIPSVRTVNPEVDVGIARWLERMLAKAPEKRYASADLAWVDLEDVVLELLGPRWRREARITVTTDAPAPERTLTPASFDSVSSDVPDEATAPEEPARDDVVPGQDGVRVIPATIDGPAVGAATVAPRRQRERGHTTLLRSARRHREPEDSGDSDSGGVGRRRLVAAAVVGAMILAAVGGVLVAGSGSSRSPTPKHPSAAQVRAQGRQQAAARQRIAAIEAADARLKTILGRLGVTRTRNLGRILNARTPTSEMAAVTAVQRAYASTARQVGALNRLTPAAGPLETTLKRAVADYRRASQAGRANDQTGWNRAWRAISSDERRIAAQAAKL